MRSAARQNDTKRSRIRRSGVTALISMTLTSIFLLIVSLCVSKGVFRIEQGERLVLLCAFMGTLTASIWLNRRGGRGALCTSAYAFAIYTLLLYLTRLFFETRPILSPQLLKNEICAAAGFLFGCAICTFRKPYNEYNRK